VAELNPYRAGVRQRGHGRAGDTVSYLYGPFQGRSIFDIEAPGGRTDERPDARVAVATRSANGFRAADYRAKPGTALAALPAGSSGYSEHERRLNQVLDEQCSRRRRRTALMPVRRADLT
jgi:hypothetical protein